MFMNVFIAPPPFINDFWPGRGFKVPNTFPAELRRDHSMVLEHSVVLTQFLTLSKHVSL